MNEIILKFIKQKAQIHPVTGRPLSKEKRMDTMYKIVTNHVYGIKYDRNERILAADFIRKIVEED